MTRRDFLSGLASGLAAVGVNLSQDTARESANENNHRLHVARETARQWFADRPRSTRLAWDDGDRSYRAERFGKGWRLLEYVEGEVITRHTDQGGGR